MKQIIVGDRSISVCQLDGIGICASKFSSLSDEQIISKIREAIEVMSELCNLPLIGRELFSFEEYRHFRQMYPWTRDGLASFYWVRREQDLKSQYEKSRHKLFKQLIERGDEYVCAADGCDERANLQIDHIYPISKGGTNALPNLQFLCKRHNVQKGAKIGAFENGEFVEVQEVD